MRNLISISNHSSGFWRRSLLVEVLISVIRSVFCAPIYLIISYIYKCWCSTITPVRDNYQNGKGGAQSRSYLCAFLISECRFVYYSAQSNPSLGPWGLVRSVSDLHNGSTRCGCTKHKNTSSAVWRADEKHVNLPQHDTFHFWEEAVGGLFLPSSEQIASIRF